MTQHSQLARHQEVVIHLEEYLDRLSATIEAAGYAEILLDGGDLREEATRIKTETLSLKETFLQELVALRNRTDLTHTTQLLNRASELFALAHGLPRTMLIEPDE